MLPSCSKVIFLGSLLASSFLSAELTPFLADHCFDCHDGATQKGGLNLEDLAQDFDDSANAPETQQSIKILVIYFIMGKKNPDLDFCTATTKSPKNS